MPAYTRGPSLAFSLIVDTYIVNRIGFVNDSDHFSCRNQSTTGYEALQPVTLLIPQQLV